MDGSDEPDEPADPAVHRRELVERELSSIREGEYRERSGFQGEEDAKREKSEGHESGSPSHGPPGLVNGIMSDIFVDVVVVHRSCLDVGVVLGGRTSATAHGNRRRGSDVVGTGEGKDHGEDKDESE